MLLGPHIPAMFTVPSSQEHAVLAQQCLTFVHQQGTVTEQVYLAHALQGDTGPEIAQQFGVCRDTVDEHLRTVRRKLVAWCAL